MCDFVSDATKRGRRRTWSAEDRWRHDRRGLRHPSDPTDAAWALVAPRIPPAERGGRRREADAREVPQGVLHVLETGRRWRHLPKDFPPRSTVWAYFDLWRHDGTLDRLHAAQPTAAIIDGRTAKSAEKGGANPQETGFDAGRKTKGVKRHVLVDTLGLMLRVAIRPANAQDRDGAARVLDKRTRRRFPFIETVFADQGRQGPKAARAVASSGTWRPKIVRRAPGTKGCVVLPKRWPKRWIVERTLSWIRRNRRLARNVEHLARTAEALVKLAMIKMMLRRLASRETFRTGS
ncbi:MAG: IS5 family transposase [Geminicoccaceae bacterium]|nr:IS5 family transposase [Geminicoccaceae bacterium]